MSESLLISSLIPALLASELTALRDRQALLELLNRGVSLNDLLKNPTLAKNVSVLASQLSSKNVVCECKEKLESWLEQGIFCLSWDSADYPALLRCISDPPFILFYKGVFPKALPMALSVVGARNSNPHGCRIAFDLSQAVCQAGNTIVSGLALGIDAASHRGSLKAGSDFPTVAVLGSGVDTVYPKQNSSLAQEIIDQGGLVLSQFAPGTAPYPSNFLNRNRIIAGLSCGTLVVQAGKRSGSQATARYALEHGREVLAVPGAIDDPRYLGTNSLIQQGAAIVTKVDDIFEALPMLNKTPQTERAKNHAELFKDDKNKQAILSILRQESKVHLDDLQALLSDSQNLTLDLLDLELANIIQRHPGNFVELLP